METIVVIAVLAVLIGFAVLVFQGTRTKNKWGINLTRLQCPRCGAEAALLRKPKSLQQTLWGGVTCTKCGCEIDKWGRDVTAGGPPSTGR